MVHEHAWEAPEVHSEFLLLLERHEVILLDKEQPQEFPSIKQNLRVLVIREVQGKFVHAFLDSIDNLHSQVGRVLFLLW